LKIDELPQLINVLKGEMAIVGPRPEDPRIVDEYYTREHLETLSVLPGLASPGSIYNYTHGERLLSADNTEQQYVEQLMPVKLALDIVYVREASFVYDLKIILRTIGVILAIALGKREFADPPEMIKAARQTSRVATKTA
jgi:lipopolysaccharide/colanic/teichoic acid biosynthesis glycosyltransferase